MADAKISALTNYTTPIGTDVLPIVDVTNVITKKIPLNVLASILNLPEGVMVNGKIDPSATDPVYCRIGGVVRTITGALNIGTQSAGTSYLNLGSAELATKETDLFVYLDYNTSLTSVQILVSRIPYANTVGDFTFSTTVEKGILRTSISNNSTDVVVNIGRFAATLSAGAGYTWSVPTFTASNLINRPIYETRVLQFSPQYTGGTNQPLFNNTTYQLVGKNVSVIIAASSLITSNSTAMTVSMPFVAGIGFGVMISGGRIYDNSGLLSTMGAIYLNSSSNAFTVTPSNTAVWTATGTKLAEPVITYPISNP